MGTASFYAADGFQIVFWRNVLIADLDTDIDLVKMCVMGRAYRALLADHPRGVVGMSRVRAGVPVSSKESRAENVRYTKELGDSILSLVTIVEDKGVAGEVIRSVIRGIEVVTRISKMVVVATLDEGMKAVLPLVPRVRPTDDYSDELRGVIDAVRSSTRVPRSQRLRAAR
jgi:hypothetical protein